MTDGFKNFLRAEVDTILASMDDDARHDPCRCTAKALGWIEKNAARFRKDWESTSQKSPVSKKIKAQ
ncbi:MAG: hypothetical protein GF401_18195 [Chitinivibrionales bacterium]|nr:hypothetical protein [Chitinivibrionales bacterium]